MEPTPNLDLIRDWMERLRTYPQIQGLIHTKNGYCCLGVAEETVYGKEVWYEKFKGGGIFRGFDDSTTNPSVGTLESLGLGRNVLNPDIDSFADFLAAYNDAGYSFDFIRKLIGTYLLIPLEREMEGQ
jgi:hypothetical protein